LKPFGDIGIEVWNLRFMADVDGDILGIITGLAVQKRK
jgi:hypothetical protein